MRSIEINELQSQLLNVIEEIESTRASIQIESEGERLAVLVPPEEYDRFQRVLDMTVSRARETIEQIQKQNEHLTEAEREEIEELITETVEEVRQEMYEERLKSTSASGH